MGRPIGVLFCFEHLSGTNYPVPDFGRFSDVQNDRQNRFVSKRSLEYNRNRDHLCTNLLSCRPVIAISDMIIITITMIIIVQRSCS